jgi:HK97 gp10 family phage protein
MATSGGITVKIHGLEPLKRKLHSARADAPVQRFLDRGSIFTQSRARENAPVDRGRLRNSIGIEKPTVRSRRIGPNVNYAEWVETGTRPHWPPPGALAGWARRHGVSEYAVRRKIGLYGTKAQPYMRPAAEAAEPFMRSLVPILAAEIEVAYAR